MAIVVFVLSMVPSCKASCFFAAWNGANGNAWFGPNGGKSSLWPFTQIMRPPPSNIHVLILPGFGNEAFDYTKEGSIIDSLQKRNWKREQLHVVPLNRFDWLLVFAKGLWDEEFRNGQADPTRPAFGWYLNRVATEIDKIVQQQDKAAGDSDDNKKERQIILLGHSAGGWLARAALGFYGVDNDDDDDEEEEDDASPPSARDSLPTIPLDRILGVVTLGAPNQPPPQHVMDMTRGAFTTTCQLFPSASYFTNRNIFYMTVTGNAVEGEYQARSSFLEPSTTKGFAYESYKTVCGTGETMGDGVVPTCSAHVDDAVQVSNSIVDDIFEQEQFSYHGS